MARQNRNLIIVTPKNTIKFALNTGMRCFNFNMSKVGLFLYKVAVALKIKSDTRPRLEEKD